MRECTASCSSSGHRGQHRQRRLRQDRLAARRSAADSSWRTARRPRVIVIVVPFGSEHHRAPSRPSPSASRSVLLFLGCVSRRRRHSRSRSAEQRSPGPHHRGANRRSHRHHRRRRRRFRCRRAGSLQGSRRSSGGTCRGRSTNSVGVERGPARSTSALRSRTTRERRAHRDRPRRRRVQSAKHASDDRLCHAPRAPSAEARDPAVAAIVLDVYCWLRRARGPGRRRSRAGAVVPRGARGRREGRPGCSCSAFLRDRRKIRTASRHQRQLAEAAGLVPGSTFAAVLARAATAHMIDPEADCGGVRRQRRAIRRLSDFRHGGADHRTSGRCVSLSGPRCSAPATT